MYYVSKNNINKIQRYWKLSNFKEGSFKKGWHPAHPSFFVRKNIYEKYGVFDLNIKISADFELMLRFLERYKISSSYLNKVIVKMRIGGESNRSIKNIILGNLQVLKAFDKNKIKVNKILYFFYRFIPKIIQIIYKGNVK